MKGALLSFTSAFGASVPNLIVFQFNPESLRHAWAQATPPATTEAAGANPQATRGLPTETFSFTLAMDSNDEIADAARTPLSASAPTAVAVGLYARIAALELLMFPAPTPNNLTSGDAPPPTSDSSTTASTDTAPRTTPASLLPVVLFVWGAGRIVPVRVTSLSFTETLFDKQLNPTHAEAQIELRVLTPTDYESSTDALASLADGAWSYTQKKRALLGLINLGAAGSALDLPPIPGT